MTTDLITVNPADKLTQVKEVFDSNNIHHIPVVRFKEGGLTPWAMGRGGRAGL
ncbi:MAG: CBS domain-containing protein [Bacteroidota bacterium]